MKYILLAFLIVFAASNTQLQAEEVKNKKIKETGSATLFLQCASFASIMARYVDGNDKKEAKQLSNMYDDSAYVVLLSLDGYDRFKFKNQYDYEKREVYTELETTIKASPAELQKYKDQCLGARLMEIAMGFLSQVGLDEKYLPDDDR